MAITHPTSSMTVGSLRAALAGHWQTNQLELSAIDGLPLARIVTDCREVRRGDIFWGLPGKQCDGGLFATEAFARGAWGVISQLADTHAPVGCWALTVEDSLAALRELAAWNRRRSAAEVVAVTGSVGKTTTRQMINAVLRGTLSGVVTPRNYNNHVGLPLSLMLLAPEHEFGIFELGASAAGEISGLAAVCQPSLAVVTRIAEAHLASFVEMETTARTKLSVLDHLPKDGPAILFDDPWLRKFAPRDRKLTWVGKTLGCDLMATEVRYRQGLLSFTLDQFVYKVPVWGRHYLPSALAAIAVGRAFGLTAQQIAAGLASFQPPPQRCQVAQVGGIQVINDTCNANPTAMRAALDVLREFEAPGRRIVVCGDMRELGPDDQQMHANLGRDVVTRCGADLLVACGEHAEHVVRGAEAAGMSRPRLAAFHDPIESVPQLLSTLQPGDVVLVKGSRAMRMERVVEALARRPLARAA